jgi:hypothetical protein
MPSQMDDILIEVTKISLFPRISQIALQVQVEGTLELNALRILDANVLTSSIIPLFCRLLWMQILNL